jgi:hypothetical protein
MFWKFIAEGGEQGVGEGSEGGIVGAKLKTLLPAIIALTATGTTNAQKKRTNLKRVTFLHKEAE